MSRDWDGDPTHKDYNRAGLKKQPHHSPKMYATVSKPHMGDREGAYQVDEE